MRIAFAVSIALSITSAHAQTVAPTLWTGESPQVPAAEADREYPGARAVGDTLAESASINTRTALLQSTYEAQIQGKSVVLPVDTPFVAMPPRISIPAAGASTVRQPEAAPGTVIWCAIPESGYAPCFFWDTAGGVHAQALMTGGPIDERIWLGSATSVPAPNIVEKGTGLPQNEKQLVLDSINNDGFAVRYITREAGRGYSQTSRRLDWGSWHNTFVRLSQRMRATPIFDDAGVLTGADVEFTRAQP